MSINFAEAYIFLRLAQQRNNARLVELFTTKVNELAQEGAEFDRNELYFERKKFRKLSFSTAYALAMLQQQAKGYGDKKPRRGSRKDNIPRTPEDMRRVIVVYGNEVVNGRRSLPVLGQLNKIYDRLRSDARATAAARKDLRSP